MSAANPAIAFINDLYEPTDFLAFMLMPQGEAPAHRFVTVAEAVTAEFIAKLEAENKNGANIYLAMNPVKAGSNRRLKENVATIRNLWIDIDTDGRAKLEKLFASKIVPDPSMVLESSPDRFQFLWKVEGFEVPEAESLLKLLAIEFGGDTNATDASRVLRVPGFQNHKYADKPIVQTVHLSEAIAKRYVDSDFRIKREASASSKQPSQSTTERRLIPHGEMYGHLITQAGKLWHEGYPSAEIPDMLVAWAHSNCEEPINEAKVRQYAKGSNWENGGGLKPQVLLGGQQAGLPREEQLNSNVLVIPSSSESCSEPWKLHGMTEEEYETEQDKEFPVLPLPAQPGPAWTDDILYGIAGEIVKKASGYCEAHPAGMYLDLLVAMGNIFGRQPHFKVNETHHHTNEFVARVGLTSTARKGTGQDAINDIIRKLDANWYTRRVLSGFGSAQAIVHEIRDSFTQQVRDKKGSSGFKEITVVGVDDKRLFIRESELAGIFKLASMKDSQVDVILRLGWDSHPLQNIVKGKSIDGISNSTRCDEPHISISADTTKSELIKTLPDGSDANGFGNRFLYCYVYRTKLCPNGSPEIDWSNEIMKLIDSIVFANTIKYVPLSKSAHKLWNRMYAVMEQSRPQGLVGLMTARGPAHVRRLALILALLDLSTEVDCQHIHAAKKIWDYCEESALYIFAGVTKDQQQILNFVRAHSNVTGPQITRQLFWNNRPANWVRDQINELQRNGWLTISGDQIQLGKRGQLAA